MGFLLGLPLKLLALVFGLLRVLIPVLLLILVVRFGFVYYCKCEHVHVFFV